MRLANVAPIAEDQDILEAFKAQRFVVAMVKLEIGLAAARFAAVTGNSESLRTELAIARRFLVLGMSNSRLPSLLLTLLLDQFVGARGDLPPRR